MHFMNALLKYHLLPSPESLQQLDCFILFLKARNKYVYVLKGVILTDDGKYLIENNRCVKSTPGYIGKVETILYKLEDKPNRWMLQVWFYGKKFDKLYWYNFDINNGKILYNGTGLQHRDREICTLIFNLYKYPDKEEDTDLKNVKSEEVSTRRTILVKNL